MVSPRGGPAGASPASNVSMQVGAKLSAIDRFKELSATMATSQNAFISFTRSTLVTSGVLTVMTSVARLLMHPISQIAALVGGGAVGIQWAQFTKATQIASNSLRAMGLTAEQARESIARLRGEMGLVASSEILNQGGAGLRAHLSDSDANMLSELTQDAYAFLDINRGQFFRAGAQALQPGASTQYAQQWLQMLHEMTNIFSVEEWDAMQKEPFIPGRMFEDGIRRQLTGQNVAEIYRNVFQDMTTLPLKDLQLEGEKTIELFTLMFGPATEIPVKLSTQILSTTNEALTIVGDTLGKPGEITTGGLALKDGMSRFLIDNIKAGFTATGDEVIDLNESFKTNVVDVLTSDTGLATVLSGDEMSGIIAAWVVGRKTGAGGAAATYLLTSKVVQEAGIAISLIQEGDIMAAAQSQGTNLDTVTLAIGTLWGKSIGNAILPAAQNALTTGIQQGTFASNIQSTINNSLSKAKFNFTISGAIVGMTIGQIAEEFLTEEQSEKISTALAGAFAGWALAGGGASLTTKLKGAGIGAAISSALLTADDFEEAMTNAVDLASIGAQMGAMIAFGKAGEKMATRAGATGSIKPIAGAAGGLVGMLLASTAAMYLADSLLNPDFSQMSTGESIMQVVSWAGLGASIGFLVGNAFGAVVGGIVGAALGSAFVLLNNLKNEAKIEEAVKDIPGVQADYRRWRSTVAGEFDLATMEAEWRRMGYDDDAIRMMSSQYASQLDAATSWEAFIASNPDLKERAIENMVSQSQRRFSADIENLYQTPIPPGYDPSVEGLPLGGSAWDNNPYRRRLRRQGIEYQPRAEGEGLLIQVFIGDEEVDKVVKKSVGRMLGGQNIPEIISQSGPRARFTP